MSEKYSETVVFLNFDGTEGSVFWSQVVAPLRGLQAKGITVYLLVFNRVDALLNPQKRAKALEKSTQTGLPTRVLPRLPFISTVGLYASVPFLYKALKALGNRPLILHARGPFAAFLALALRRLKRLEITRIVYDCRGDILAEYNEYRRQPSLLKRFRLWQLFHLERMVLQGIDQVNVVSKPLEHMLRQRYGFQGTCSVTPSAINVAEFQSALQSRPNVRSEMGLSGKLVLVYSGSMLAWQLPHELVRIFRWFRQIEKTSVFLILTSEPGKIRSLLQNAEISEEDYRIVSADSRMLPLLLACGDVGLLLRQPNDTNRVASPTKFAEYLTAGVPVLLTEGIGDLDDVVKKHHLGWILTSLDDEAIIEATVKQVIAQVHPNRIDRERLRKIAAELFSMESHVDRLLASYQLRPATK